MFVNAPFTTTVYTHEVGKVVYTATVLDLDGSDKPAMTKESVLPNPDPFEFNETSGKLIRT